MLDGSGGRLEKHLGYAYNNGLTLDIKERKKSEVTGKCYLENIKSILDMRSLSFISDIEMEMLNIQPNDHIRNWELRSDTELGIQMYVLVGIIMKYMTSEEA